jgi:hypothetical protein
MLVESRALKVVFSSFCIIDEGTGEVKDKVLGNFALLGGGAGPEPGAGERLTEPLQSCYNQRKRAETCLRSCPKTNRCNGRIFFDQIDHTGHEEVRRLR